MANSKTDQALIKARLKRLPGLTTQQITSLSQTLNPQLVNAMSDALLTILVNTTLPTLPVNPDQGLPLGLPGAVAPTRFVGATASGAPTVGDFVVGDWIVDVGNRVFRVCIAAGSPGSWAAASGSTITAAGIPDGYLAVADGGQVTFVDPTSITTAPPAPLLCK